MASASNPFIDALIRMDDIRNDHKTELLEILESVW